MRDYLELPFKNLKHRGLRSWLTLLGIVIGITAVVSLISLGEGLKVAVNSQFGISTTEVITVQAGGLTGYGPPGTGTINPLTWDNVDEIEIISSVNFAVGRLIETIKINYNKKMIFGFATNVPRGEKGDFFYKIAEIESLQGRLLQAGESNKIVLGYNFLDSEKNGFGKAVNTGDSLEIQGKEFRVVGILKKKGSFIWDNIVLIGEESLKELVNNTEEVDLIAVHVKNKDLMGVAKEDIEKLLREKRNVKLGEEDFEVSTPEATLATVNSILTGIQLFIVLIASVSIIVGSIGIINTMTTSVLERVKEIGIMKSIGAKNSDIFFQFFVEAGLLGLVGGIIGCALGIGLSFIGIQAVNNFLGADNQFKLNIFLIGGTLIGSFLIGSTSGIAPALKAAKLNPIEALRK
jgi:putative ABC transport system permease protein